MKLYLKHFDIEQIAASGQCFRMKKQETGGYLVIAGNRAVKVEQLEKDLVLLNCSDEEFEEFWRQYFDCDVDYGAFCDAVPLEDIFLQQAIQFGAGLRILRQDLGEMMVSFIISQNNNIPRIQKSIELLCTNLGDKQILHDGTVYYGFPSQKQLYQASLSELREMGLGYRDQYIYALARADLKLEALKNADWEEAHAMLTTYLGIGPKVANCICLFGLHHLGAFPVDTWIRKTVNKYYQGSFPLERYEGFAGVIQQYMFYYGRSGESDCIVKRYNKNVDNGISL